MTKIQNSPLFNNPICLLIFLLIYLIVPISCGIKFYPPFITQIILFIYLFTGSIIYLLLRKVKKKKITLAIQIDQRSENINILNEKIENASKIVSALENKIQRYNILKSLTEELVQSLSLDNAVEILMNKVYSLIGHSKGVAILYLLDAEKQKLSQFASLKEKGIGLDAKNADIFDKWIFKYQMPLIVEDTKKDFRFDAQEVLRHDRAIGSLIGAPLIVGKRLIGILRLDNRESKAFSSDDLRFISVISDLAALSIDNSRLYQHTRQLAITDGLTGLYLRQYFMFCLNSEIKQAMLNKLKFSLLMIDIDLFKNYNDRFGHISGDVVLNRIAKYLKEGCPEENSILSRYGGEEFVILLLDTDKPRAKRIAEYLRKNIEAKKIILRRIESSITVSIGVATYPEDGACADELLNKADRYLYKAKQAGRNKICFC